MRAVGIGLAAPLGGHAPARFVQMDDHVGMRGDLIRSTDRAPRRQRHLGAERTVGSGRRVQLLVEQRRRAGGQRLQIELSSAERLHQQRGDGVIGAAHQNPVRRRRVRHRRVRQVGHQLGVRHLGRHMHLERAGGLLALIENAVADDVALGARQDAEAQVGAGLHVVGGQEQRRRLRDGLAQRIVERAIVGPRAIAATDGRLSESLEAGILGARDASRCQAHHEKQTDCRCVSLHATASYSVFAGRAALACST